MKTKRIIVIAIMVLSILLLASQAVSALTLPDSEYDKISWTWQYSAPATSSYNCLGYATGSMTWEWPSSWGDGATKAQVDSYMASLGYRDYIYDAFILAYGPDVNYITHFSKVTGTNWCRAKWGHLERFNHASYDPYYHTSLYGALQIKYTAN